MASSTELTPQCLLSLTLNVLYLTIPQELCRCEAKGVHGFTELISTHSEKKASFLFILCLQYQMLSTSPFSEENLAVSSEEWVLVLNVFTTANRKLRVKCSVFGDFSLPPVHFLA